MPAVFHLMVAVLMQFRIASDFLIDTFLGDMVSILCEPSGDLLRRPASFPEQPGGLLTKIRGALCLG